MTDINYRYVPTKVLNAINITEPIVHKAFKIKGYTIVNSTKDEDFNGIDFKVINPKTNKLTLIDVKCSEEKNYWTSNFLFTIKSKYGKHYKEKQTEYVAFINVPTYEIVIIDIERLSRIVDKAIPRKGNGIYVLINKKETADFGYTINYKNGSTKRGKFL